MASGGVAWGEAKTDLWPCARIQIGGLTSTVQVSRSGASDAMTDKQARTIVVFGATGTQGGGAVKELLQTGAFKVKAVTRDVSKPAAQRLQERGAEVVQADLDDPNSLQEPLQGAFGLFLVTHGPATDANTEYQRGLNAITAAERAGVQHFVFSSLEDTRPHTQDDDAFPTVCQLQGRPSKVPHKDAKGAIQVALKQSGVPSTCLYTWTFYENFMKPMVQYRKRMDGSIAALTPFQPEQYKQWHSADAIGSAVAEIFQSSSQHLRADVQVASHTLHLVTALQSIAELTGVHVTYENLPTKAFCELLSFPSALYNAIANSSKFGHEVDWEAGRSSMKVVGRGPKFREWVEQHRIELVAHIDAALSKQ